MAALAALCVLTAHAVPVKHAATGDEMPKPHIEPEVSWPDGFRVKWTDDWGQRQNWVMPGPVKVKEVFDGTRTTVTSYYEGHKPGTTTMYGPISWEGGVGLVATRGQDLKN